MGKQNAHLN